MSWGFVVASILSLQSWKKGEFLWCEFHISALCLGQSSAFRGVGSSKEWHFHSMAVSSLFTCSTLLGKEGKWLSDCMGAGLNRSSAPAAFFPAYQCAGQEEPVGWDYFRYIYVCVCVCTCTSFLLRWYGWLLSVHLLVSTVKNTVCLLGIHGCKMQGRSEVYVD